VTTLNLQVAASADDACEDGSSGNVYDTANNVYLTDSDYWGGFRWQSVTIPSGATIDSADLQVWLSDTGHDDIEVDIYGHDVADAGAFSGGSGTYDISGRARTSASVNESSSSTGTGWHSMPDVKAVVQEIVDDAGGLSSAGLALIEDGLAGIDLYQTAYDGNSDHAAKLDIDYTAAAGVAGGLVNRIPIESLVHGGLV
jgi:hypothetical protein